MHVPEEMTQPHAIAARFGFDEVVLEVPESLQRGPVSAVPVRLVDSQGFAGLYELINRRYLHADDIIEGTGTHEGFSHSSRVKEAAIWF